MAQNPNQAQLEAAQLTLLKAIQAHGHSVAHAQAVLRMAEAYAFLEGSSTPRSKYEDA